MIEILIVGQYPVGRDKNKLNRKLEMYANFWHQRHLQAQ